MITDTGTTARKLAALGGTPVVPKEMRELPWPVLTDADRQAVLATLDSGRLVSNVDGATAVSELEDRWAQRVGTERCVAVDTGTAALALALAALDIGPGDEVIVPALSFIASGFAPLYQLAVPVFVDVDPVSFTIDPAAVAAAITPRTAAILPVHLHGQPADMDALAGLASRHKLSIVEDAAQAHGATYQGRSVGSLGDVGAFSLQVTKNLPTCGEGGLLTTTAERADIVRKARQFGEIIEAGRSRDYVSSRLGWNYKLSAVQAAFALSQLDRFDEYEAARATNIPAFLDRLAELPGLTVPRPAPHTTHAWHILRFRFDPEEAGLPGVAAHALRSVLHRLLRAEGVPLSRYQLMPLPEQKAFTDRVGFGKGYPWTALREPEPHPEYPITTAIIADSLTLQKRHLHPQAGPTLQRYADAFDKVWQNLPMVADLARAAS